MYMVSSKFSFVEKKSYSLLYLFLILVIRCRDLQRSNGSINLNAYVKVALNRKSQTEHQGFQRTAVHRHSSRPYFDHCFKFDLSDLSQTLNELDEDDRLQMAVWHRDRQLK